MNNAYWVFILALTLLATPAMAADWPNPLIRHRADPFVVRHTDGYVYFTATVPEYDRIELRRAKRIEDLDAAEKVVVWRQHAKGAMGNHIWAPELHFIDGRWYVYFAAGATEDQWAIRMYALECDAANPLDGPWREMGQIKTPWESFSLDATTFVHRGVRYMVWAQNTPADKSNTDLYLAKMETPTKISGKPVRISKPDLPWERIGFNVNEGPAVLVRNGRVFMTYSASKTDANYCLGLLTADENADLLDAKSWRKSPTPVFVTHAAHRIYGPGHNCFTTADDGTDLMIYHARNDRDIVGDPLLDPNRHARVQPLTWAADGTPVFGEPRAELKGTPQ